MGPEEGRAPPERTPRYVWDPKKLTWVESGEAQAEEARVEPAGEAMAEPAPVEAISEEEAPSEGLAVEAEAEIGELEYKGVWIRLAAAVIDFVIVDIVGTIIHYALGAVVHGVAIPSYVLLAYGLVYFVGFWWWRGQTPGKMIIGARIVRTDGRPMGVDRALVRFIFYLMPLFAPITFFANTVTPWFTFLLPIVALVVMALSRQRRGIHDLIAGTCVINTRVQVLQPGEVEASETADPEQGDEGSPGAS
jgi:uncharacterized RDD family membrane protein YckC